MMSTKLSNKDSKSGISAGQRKMLRLPKPSELFDLRYYLISTKQQWPLFMLFSIVFFFAIPVVILFGTTEGNYAASWSFEKAYTSVCETLIYLTSFIAVIAAVFAGISVTRDYMKPSAACFCSALPMRRECALLVRLASGFTVFAGAFLLNFLLGMLVSIAIGGAKLLGLMLPMFHLFTAFLFIYTLVVLCGMLCGMSITQFILTALVLVLPPLTYAMFFVWMSEHINSLWYNYYMDIEAMNFFPGVRLLMMLFENDWLLTMPEILGFIALSLVFVVLSLVLVRMRINEHAGDAAMFKIVGPIVKYGSMIPAAMIGGFFFWELSSGSEMVEIMWWFFGWICASLLTFMLVNAVVHRSAKAVLRGIKWAPMFAALFMIFNVFIMGDIADIDGYIPNPRTLSAVELHVDGFEFELKSEEAINAFVKVLTSDKEGDAESDIDILSDHAQGEVIKSFEDKNIKIATTSNYIQFSAAYKLKFGPTIAKRYYGINKLRTADALRELANTEEFRTQYAEMVGKAAGSRFYASMGLASGERTFQSHSNGFIDAYGIYYELEAITIDGVTDEINADYFARPQLGTVHIYDEYNNYENYEAPLYLDDPLTADVEEAADAIEEARAANGDGEKVSYGGMMTGDTVEQFVNSYIESATIIDTKTKAEQKITNKAQLCEIMTSVQSICYGRVSMFSVPDYDYYVLIDLKNGARSYDLFLTYFIDGKAPEFVK